MKVRLGSTSRRRSGGSTVGGRIIGTVFLSFFLAAGLFMLWFLIGELGARIDARGWQETPCVILESSVAESERTHADEPFTFKVQYQYEYGGKTYSSERWSLDSARFSDYAKAGTLVERFRGDTQATCFVDPENPHDAILKRPSLWFGFVLLFPLVFILIGGGGIYAVWRKRRDGAAAQALSKRASGPMGVWVLRAFFSVFLLFGLGFLYGMFLLPLQRSFSSQDWIETPCTVTSSQVRTHSGEDGATYSIEVMYRYEIDGREFRSSRYDFSVGSTSGHDSKRDIVRRYPPGKTTVCYVNPENPYDAVLSRGVPSTIWFAFIPGIFVLVGVLGITFASRLVPARAKSRGAARRRDQADPGSKGKIDSVKRIETMDDGRVVLRATASRAAKFGCMLFVALFWNGIVIGIASAMFRDFAKDKSAIFPLLFMTPFLLVGLVLIAMVGYFFLSIFNPRPRLVVSSSSVPLGGVLDVQWQFEGRAERIKKLKIFLEGQEEATYRRGTDTTTDRRTFATLTIAETNQPSEIRGGQGRVAIPSNLMHSWEAASNKIVWKLRVSGEVPRFPDVDEEFPFTVLPHAQPPASAPI